MKTFVEWTVGMCMVFHQLYNVDAYICVYGLMVMQCITLLIGLCAIASPLRKRKRVTN